MDISGVGLLVVVLVVAVIVGFFVIKNIIKLAINSILGLLLFVFRQLFPRYDLVWQARYPD